MIDTISIFFLNGFAYIKKHPQLIVTLLLIVIIPIAFLLSGQQFLTAAKVNQERLEKDRIGLLHDSLASILRISQFDTTITQHEIEQITLLNPDIITLSVGLEREGKLLIVASNHRDIIASSLDEASAYRLANVQPNESILESYIEQGIRYWYGYRLVQSAGTDDYYIHTVTSLEHIDSLFASRIMEAYYWLFGILAIVLFLVFRHIRLIDYAYLYRETKKANEMKDLFTNMIAHELRAPLTAMRGYASMIRESTEAQQIIKDNAQKIEDAAERLVLIINDLLDVARIHSGKLAIKNIQTNIRPLITTVIDSMQSLAHEKSISLALENTGINDVFVRTDEKRFYQALTNLVSNSLKYTKAGSITISIRELHDRVEIRIKDTGMGISAENQKHLFSPFFRIENTETKNTVGTGLGMWITKQLIELMGSSIAVESIRGIGTHVVITIPK